MFNNELWQKPAGGAGGDFYTYQIAKSVRMNKVSDANGANFSKTFSSSPTSTKKGTFSTWAKRASVPSNETHNILGTGAGGGSSEQDLKFENNKIRLSGYSPSMDLTTTQLFRDTSAWYHIVVAWDTTQATSTNRLKLYVNGEQVTSFSTSTYPSQDQVILWYSNTENRIGLQSWNDSNVYNGYMAETIGIDGTTYAASDFGETKNGVWIPKDASGLTFGNNGFYLNYASSGDLGNDVSGNNNDWTPNNLAASDQTGDTPTFSATDGNGGNFATLGPLFKNPAAITLTEGNLRITATANELGAMSNWEVPDGGKWYWEVNYSDQYSTGTNFLVGIAYANTNLSAVETVDQVVYYSENGMKIIESTRSSYGTAFDSPSGNAVVGVAVDRVNDTLNFSYNGTWQGTFSISGLSNNVFFPYTGFSGVNGTQGCTYNFGQDGTFAGRFTAGGNSDDTGYGNFKYAVPTGFLALCSGNLPTATVISPAETDDNFPQKLFGATIWTGDGSTSRAITGLGFQPDWLWFKNRSSAYSNRLYDTSRGIASNGGKRLFSNTTAVENDQTSGQDISAVGADGFTLGASSNLYTNDTNSGGLQVAWTWRANGGTTVTNTQGDTDSVVQVDPSGHFSIVLGTGDNDNWGNPQTFGHGLSAAPTCILGKKRTDNADEWQVFFSDYGTYTIGGSNAACNSLVLNSDNALYTNQSYKGWGGVMPTSTVFTLDGNNLVQNGDTFVCYCFANCEGYIKSGTYIGNANDDGTFLYLGFRPAFFMCKPLAAGNWRIQDDTRSPFNVANKTLYPNHTDAEESNDSNDIDLLSNGVKMRASDSNYNQATTFVYLAFAENPFQFATAR